MKQWIRTCFLAATLAGLGIGAAQAATPLPVEHFTRRPLMDDVVISPNGTRLAVLVFGERGQRILGVMDLDPVGKPRVVASFNDADVTSVTWVNDDRLVFEAFQVETGPGVPQGGAGTFAVNHDGSDQRHLISWRNANVTGATTIASRILPYGWFLDRPAADGTDDIFVERRVRDSVGDFTGIEIARLDTKTRILKNLSYGLPEYSHTVEYDANREPRMALAERSGRATAYWREASGEWRKLGDSDALEADFSPWYIGKGGEVIIATRLGDVRALHNFDPVTGKVNPDALVQIKGFDIFSSARIDRKTRRLMGVDILADRPVTHWFDPTLQRLQKSIDAALPPGRFNTLHCGDCETTRFFVVESRSDRHPGEFYLFDRKTPSIQQIGAARPWINEETQGKRSFHRYDARDGLKVPVYVTHPAGTGPDAKLPAIVLVPGTRRRSSSPRGATV
jgi:dipeptidyl aminopeptidase/acylaminoacyl peptidase